MSTRCKILMIQTQLGYGGAETSFIRLANFLAQSMDVSVALFSTKGKYDAGHEALNAPVVVLDTPESASRVLRWGRRIVRIRKLKKHHDATISFLSGPNLVNVLSGNNARTVVSLRGSRFYDPVVPRRQKWIFQYLLDPVIYHLAARIVPVCDGLKHEIRAVAGERTLKKVRVISPFVEEKTMARHLAQVPPEPYGVLKGQPVIVGVGRLSLEKGFHHLIRVFAELTKTHSGIKLLLVGDGPMMPELRAMCSAYGIVMDDVTPGVNSVVFAGYQENVLPLMAVSSIYAMTSATEGFPNVLLEALAAGLPVIAANAPWGMRAILCDTPSPTAEPYPTQQATQADYGVLMPRIDAPEYQQVWVDILTEYLRAPKENPKAKSRVHDFDLVKVGEKWKQLIESLVN